MKNKALVLLKELAEAHGVPGHESAVREIFCRELDGRKLTADSLGNVMCEVPGETESPRVLVTGHMDEVGFVVQQITPEGFLRMAPLGGWWSHTLPAQRVRVRTRQGQEVMGVIAATPLHLLSVEAREKVMPLEKLCIDIGADSREEAEDRFGIRLGDPVAPESPFQAMAKPGRLLCKAFDNRVGVALTIQSLQELAGSGHPNTLVGVGTVQEELGLRGARTAGPMAAADVALVMEGTPADDGPDFPRGECQGRIGKGVQIRVSDPSAVMNKSLVDFVVDVAMTSGIPHQVAVRRTGGTDAGSFQCAPGGLPVVVLGVPARYIHTHNAIIDMEDYLSALRLIQELVSRFDADTVAEFTRFL